MTEFRKILVATDFSAHADAALAAAVELATKTGASLELAYSYHLPVVTAPDIAAIPTSIWDDVERGATARLEAAAAPARERGLDVSIQALQGPAGLVIPEHATSTAADLIAIGTRGLGGLKRAVLGSVAAKVVRRAPCPVLTLSEGETFAARTIAVPTDFSAHAHAAVGLARTLATLYGGHLILLHGHEVPVELRAFLHDQGMETARTLSKVARDVLDRELRDLQDAGVSAEVLLEEGSPEELVLRCIESKSVDLVVMGTHGRSGLAHLLLGSVAERVVGEAPVPVISTRDFEVE